MENSSRVYLRTCALLLSLLLLPAILASASEQPTPKPTDVPATVIGHLPLPQATGSQMLLQKENSKQYLYVQQAAKQGFMIVDVSQPEKPSLLKRTAESNQARERFQWRDYCWSKLPEFFPDPRNPKTLETFNKVTSLLPDSHHGLIYLTNDEGLWILRYNRPAPLEPAKKKPLCDSNAEIMAMPPDCD